MIFVDTNYFLRFFLKDEENQFGKARELFELGASGKAELFTSLVVIFEIYWVLADVYKFKQEDILKTLHSVMAMDFIFVENKEVLIKALEFYSQGNDDLEDCYNLAFAQSKKAITFATFDKKLIKLFKTSSCTPESSD